MPIVLLLAHPDLKSNGISELCGPSMSCRRPAGYLQQQFSSRKDKISHFSGITSPKLTLTRTENIANLVICDGNHPRQVSNETLSTASLTDHRVCLVFVKITFW